MSTNPTQEMPSKGKCESDSSLVILDIGKRDAKDIKKMREGKGKLLRKVNEAVDQLREVGRIEPSAQIVLVIVRKDMGLFDLSDDDDDNDDDDDDE